MRLLQLISIPTALAALACTPGNKQDKPAGHEHHAAVAAQPRVQHDLMLSATQERLANLAVQPLARRALGATVVNGTLTADETRTRVISSRAAGRIEKLYIQETGRRVRAGEPLYELYSEPLLVLQREYLLAREQEAALGKEHPRYANFTRAAAQKLLQYGLTQRQLDHLATTRDPRERLVFQAPVSGLITALQVTEGQAIAEGSVLYRLEDLTTLWVETELYPGEAAATHPGDTVQVLPAGDDAGPRGAVVEFISPVYRANSQVTIARARLANTDQRLHPGQSVQVLLTQGAARVLAAPQNAVIRKGKQPQVYIRTGAHTYQRRPVTLGREDAAWVEITGGLQPGDTLVTRGAYLLYSEHVLKHGL
ncbi:efflux RND transporter periplasmic adaptor subunit [Dawidia soli]|uniref:Efflux RND transporter periplasmic adaptor subunit n=1 Tax=Dawidia soli TaxID=2782352 RepID=A0AAP2DGQ1_9BACT|nr:efflux RND transporter periplasmic adaptor subunit [Dawidia soli]MBT1690385.1 efflux RND transporter periplasmic adaptor subunit [Dawidia soli]